MDYRHDFRFVLARWINRVFFAVPFQKSIAWQFPLVKHLLPRPDEPTVVPTKDGILMRLDIHTDAGEALRGSIDRNLYYLGTYEIATLEVVRHYLKKGGIFIDVGSHNGSVALFAAVVAKAARVLAFEPVSALQYRLRDNMTLNQATNIEPIQVALSSHKGKQVIHINHNNRGSSSFIKNQQETYQTKETVVLDTLDNQLARLKVAEVNMIKIDVEGYELEVLRGAKKTIQTHRPIVIIEHDPRNDGVQAPYKFIADLGLYSVYMPKNGRHIKGPLMEVGSYDDLPQSYVTNFVCLPKDR